MEAIDSSPVQIPPRSEEGHTLALAGDTDSGLGPLQTDFHEAVRDAAEQPPMPPALSFGELVEDAVQRTARAYAAGFEVQRSGSESRPDHAARLEQQGVPAAIEALAKPLMAGELSLEQAFQVLAPAGEAGLFVLCELLDTLLRCQMQGRGTFDFHRILQAWADSQVPDARLEFLTQVMAQRPCSPELRQCLVEGVLGCVETLEPSFSDTHRTLLKLIDLWLGDIGIRWTAGQAFALQQLYVKTAWGIAALAEDAGGPALRDLQSIEDPEDAQLLAAVEQLKLELKDLVKELDGLPDAPELVDMLHSGTLPVEVVDDIARRTQDLCVLASHWSLLSPQDAYTLRVAANKARYLAADFRRHMPRLGSEALPPGPLSLKPMEPDVQKQLGAQIVEALKHIRKAGLRDMASSGALAAAQAQLEQAVQAQVDIAPVIQDAQDLGAPPELLREMLLNLSETLLARARHGEVFDARPLLGLLLRLGPDQASVRQLALRLAKATEGHPVQVMALLEAIYRQVTGEAQAPLSVADALGYGTLHMALGEAVLATDPESLPNAQRQAVARWCNAIHVHCHRFLQRSAPSLKDQVLL